MPGRGRSVSTTKARELVVPPALAQVLQRAGGERVNGRRRHPSLVAYGRLSRNNRLGARSNPSRARWPTKTRMPTNICQLCCVACTTDGHRLPHRPQHRLGDRDGPYQPIEIPSFVALALCRTFHPRQSSGRAKHPECPRNRKVCEVIHFLQPPLASDNRVIESCHVQ